MRKDKSIIKRDIKELQKMRRAIEELPEEESFKFADAYIRVLFDLSSAHFECDEIREAIEVQKYLLAIIEPLYKKDPKKWGDTFRRESKILADYSKNNKS